MILPFTDIVSSPGWLDIRRNCACAEVTSFRGLFNLRCFAEEPCHSACLKKVLDRCPYSRQKHLSAPGWLDIRGNFAFEEMTSVQGLLKTTM